MRCRLTNNGFNSHLISFGKQIIFDWNSFFFRKIFIRLWSTTRFFFPDWIDILSIKMITSSICGERSFAQKLKDHQLYNGHQQKIEWSNFTIKHTFKQIVTASSIRRKKSERERETTTKKILIIYWLLLLASTTSRCYLIWIRIEPIFFIFPLLLLVGFQFQPCNNPMSIISTYSYVSGCIIYGRWNWFLLNISFDCFVQWIFFSFHSYLRLAKKEINLSQYIFHGKVWIFDW